MADTSQDVPDPKMQEAMTGFRTKQGGGGRAGGPFRGGPMATAPFTHAQILHLMKTEFARARRYGFPVSCLLFQVDRLQALVDIHGTELRERLRGELARLVGEKTRGADQLGTISDDRFLLLLPHTGEEQAKVVGERIRRSFGELEVTAKGSVLALTLSLGLASSTGQDTLFFDTMLARAEAALDWARQGGGARLEVFRQLPPG